MSDRTEVGYVREMNKHFVTLAVLALAGCASATNFRESNRVNLDRLVLGMDRIAVLDVMGVGQQRQFTGSEIDQPIGTGRDSLGVMSVQIPVGGNRPVLYNPHRVGLDLRPPPAGDFATTPVEVLRIAERVTVHIDTLVAGVSEGVAIGVHLVGVVDVAAVVADVPEEVVVWIPLIAVRSSRAVVGGVDGAVRIRVRRAANGDVEVRQLESSSATLIFEALDKGKPLGLYAIIAQRTPVCDVCHSILFALAFDEVGNVRGFLPIYVTKFGNEVWDDEDEAHLSGRLVGQRMEGLTFDPSVDAVTSATMSSTLIFDEARRAAKLLETLKAR